MITKSRLVQDLRKLGVEENDNLLVKCSIRSLGPVQGGINTVLESLLEAVGEKGSVIGMSYTYCYKLPLSKKNAQKVFHRYTPTNTGAFNQYLIHHSSAMRSQHPVNSFVGIGPKAYELLKEHDSSKPAREPILRLSKEKNSKGLLLGTIDITPGSGTIHVAQTLLNLKQNTFGKYGVNYYDEKGEIKTYIHREVGGCSKGDWKFHEHYRKNGACSEGKVGNAQSMLVNLNKSIEIEMELMRKDPTFFFCDNPWCLSCRTSWEFSEKTMKSQLLKIFYPALIPVVGPIARSLKISGKIKNALYKKTRSE